MRSVGNLLEVQPEWCRQPLPVKQELHWYFKPDALTEERIKRVMFLDPTEFYKRVHSFINPFSRYTSVPMAGLFPKPKDKTCSCGCGKVLEGRQTRWATIDCNKYAMDIWSIMVGRIEVIDRYLNIYYGFGCTECGTNNYDIDHQWPVKFGGTGGWLSNYKKLCKACHRTKTNKDFGWKQPKPIKPKTQIDLVFPSADGIFNSNLNIESVIKLK